VCYTKQVSGRGGEDGTKERDQFCHAELCRRVDQMGAAASAAVGVLIERRSIIVKNAAGNLLPTLAMRRRHLGRLFYCGGDYLYSS
jgi:hypothetical protein